MSFHKKILKYKRRKVNFLFILTYAYIDFFYKKVKFAFSYFYQFVKNIVQACLDFNIVFLF